MIIAIYGSRRQHGAVRQIGNFLNELVAHDICVVMHPKLYHHLSKLNPDCLKGVILGDERRVEADFAVSLGGDGTFLRTAVWTCCGNTPIIGVNTGHLGYLTALDVDSLPELPDMLRNDAFIIEHRTLLQVESPRLPASMGRYALNEVAITKEESASMIVASVNVDETPLADYRADGLIVCTSTGSTAYNLSVGGPIVQPTVGVWVLAPVAAHSLSMRPLVISADSVVDIVPTGRSPHVRLAVDGRSTLIETGTHIRLSRAPFTLPLMQLKHHSFASVLRTKLHWGEQ
ncbi:MAG: NAD(+)/NADH kinase [Muribaculaceae bacterium]|nr:NAD(+)/NADH kinase [Muribaculaceae bacterium]